MRSTQREVLVELHRVQYLWTYRGYFDWIKLIFGSFSRFKLAEHPFGTLKRQHGFIFTLMKWKEKVSGEVGLEFISYNSIR